MRDVRGAVRAIVRALGAMAGGAAEGLAGAEGGGGGGGGGASMTQRGADAVVAQCGRVISLCDGVKSLPTTPSAAVRRALLSAAKLVKTSALEIKEEQGVAAADAPASGAGAGAGAAAVVIVGLDVLRSTMALLKHSLAAVDAALDASAPAAAGAAAAEGDLDHVAEACSVLKDVVIDFAAELNAGDDDELDFGDGDGALNEEDEGAAEAEGAGTGEGGAGASMGEGGGAQGDGSVLRDAAKGVAASCSALAAALHAARAPALGEVDAAAAAVGAAVRQLAKR